MAKKITKEQQEKFSQLTVDDLEVIDDTIYRVSDGHFWAKCSSQFWRDVLAELQGKKEQ